MILANSKLNGNCLISIEFLHQYSLYCSLTDKDHSWYLHTEIINSKQGKRTPTDYVRWAQGIVVLKTFGFMQKLICQAKYIELKKLQDSIYYSSHPWDVSITRPCVINCQRHSYRGICVFYKCYYGWFVSEKKNPMFVFNTYRLRSNFLKCCFCAFEPSCQNNSVTPPAFPPAENFSESIVWTLVEN